MIHVIATIELKAGTRQRFLHEFMKIVPAVRAEDGCIEYGAAVDVASGMAAQGAVRADVVTVVEKWSSLATLAAHSVAPHMQAYRPRVKEFVVRTALQILEPVDHPLS